jgi:hypothetical protein
MAFAMGADAGAAGGTKAEPPCVGTAIGGTTAAVEGAGGGVTVSRTVGNGVIEAWITEGASERVGSTVTPAAGAPGAIDGASSNTEGDCEDGDPPLPSALPIALSASTTMIAGPTKANARAQREGSAAAQRA